MDIHSLRIDKINGECSTAAIEEIVRITRSADPRLVPHWVPELRRLFESVGLVDFRRGTRERPGCMDYTFHKTVLKVHDIIARKARNEEVGRCLKEILPEVLKDTYNGAFHAWTRQTVIEESLNNCDIKRGFFGGWSDYIVD